MSELAVVVIHGMGTQEPDYAEEMIDELNKRVAKRRKDPTKIAWKTIFWADILDGRELAYFRRAKNRSEMDYLRLRKFIVTSLGDAVAYQKVTSQHNTAYRDIHGRVGQAIHDLYVGDLQSRPKPMIVLAHSLGGHIMSNHIWDMQHPKPGGPPALSPFERMKWLSGFVTFGCNIPLFTFAYSVVEPIKFPPPGLRPDLRDKARWLNFYDPDDVLAYPLRPVSPKYSQVVDRDIAINAGGIFSSWNPLSHLKYWEDNDFTKPVAAFLASFL